MNLTYYDRVVLHFRIEEISCYYFCDHFCNISKTRKNDDTEVSFLKNTKKKQYYKCRDFTRGLVFYLKPKSEKYFEEAKKSLIQYIPTVVK